MALPPLEAINVVVEFLDLYKGELSLEDLVHPMPGKYSPEDFLIARLEKNGYSEFIQRKIAELFFNIVKYRQFFALILDDYYTFKNRRFPRVPTDTSVLLVFLYFAIIELKENSKEEVQEMLIKLNDQKALSLFGYLKKNHMLTKLFELGCTIWDIDYVRDVLRNVIKEPLFEEVYQHILKHIEQKKQTKVKQPTVPVDMMVLNHPKKMVPPKEVPERPMPSKIPVSVRASEIPRSTYVKPKFDKRLEAMRQKNHLEALELYEEAQKNAVSCANPMKSKKYVETIQKIQSERLTRHLKKKSVKKIKEDIEITPKTTATVVLREGARLMKIEQNEIKRYQELASGGFNAGSFLEWEQEMRDQAERQKLEEIARKHLEGLISYEEALIAKQNFIKKSKEKAEELRKERELWLQQLEEWKKEEEARLQESVEKGKAVERGMKEALEHCREEKQKSALEVMEESKALKERFVREKEEDLNRKVQLIQEIKALQALTLFRPKQPDLTETGNVGLLCEMSIAELRERLVILSLELKEEVEKRRDVFRRRRERRREMLESYEDLIQDHHQIRRQVKDTQQVEEKRKTVQVTSRSIEDLRKKLQEKREERLKQKHFA